MHPHVLSVSASGTHEFSKPVSDEIHLLQGLGIAGDAHCGATVKHRSRVKEDPTQPNLRQVHLIHAELLEELKSRGFEIKPGQMGENITTQNLDLLALPTDTELILGAAVVIRLTGLRNPCVQLDRFRQGLMSAVLDRNAQGDLVRKAGVMGIVVRGGAVRIGDAIQVRMPELPHRPLVPV